MKLSRERRVGTWVKPVMIAWAVVMCFMVPTFAFWTDRGPLGMLVAALWLLLLVIDVPLYGMAAWPARCDLIGNWPLSGIVAFLVFGRNKTKLMGQ